MIRILTFLLLTFSFGYCLAGAWPQKKGGSYQQVSFTHLKYSSLFNQELGNRELKREITDLTFQHYMEYGITDKITFISVLPFKYLSSSDEVRDIDPEEDILSMDTANSGTLQGLSNLSFAGKFLIKQNKYVSSFQLTVGTSTAKFQNETGLRTGFDCWLITPSFHLGRGWGGTYLTGEMGYQFKSNNYSDNIILNLEYGGVMKWNKMKTWFIFAVNSVIPIKDEKYLDGRSIQTGLYQNGTGYISPGIKINHYFTDHFAINLGGYGAFWADLNARAPTLNAGISYEW